MMASLQYSFEKSSRTIETMTQTTLAELREKRITPAMSVKAAIWLPKAEQADRYKNELLGEIDRVATACEINRGSCKETDLASLKNRLKVYSDSSLNIDPLIKAEFARNFADTADNGQSLSSTLNRLKSGDRFSQKEQAALVAQLKLSVIQNTSDIIRYCTEQVPDPGPYFSVYSAIIGQNSNALLPGEQLEITAGIGLFSRRAQPTAVINGKPCDLGEDATFNYLIRPKGKPGIYTIPIVLDFFDEDGNPVKISKNITYRLLPAPADK